MQESAHYEILKLFRVEHKAQYGSIVDALFVCEEIQHLSGLDCDVEETTRMIGNLGKKGESWQLTEIDQRLMDRLVTVVARDIIVNSLDKMRYDKQFFLANMRAEEYRAKCDILENANFTKTMYPKDHKKSRNNQYRRHSYDIRMSSVLNKDMAIASSTSAMSATQSTDVDMLMSSLNNVKIDQLTESTGRDDSDVLDLATLWKSFSIVPDNGEGGV